MTSASLGTGAAAETAGKLFAEGLTGKRAVRSFAVVRGTKEARLGAKPGTSAEAAAFAMVDPAIFAGVDLAAVRRDLGMIAAALQWPAPPADDDMRYYAARQLTGMGPFELLIETCAGNATAFENLAGILYPATAVTPEQAERATDGLLALGCFARRYEPGRQEQPLLPTRVHMLFRGLPSIHACLNAVCTERRFNPGESALLGRLYTEPRTHCGCGSRVFEIYTHRDCGAAFLRAFGTDKDAEFLWNERGGRLTEFGQPLHEIHLLLEEPHPDQEANVDLIWLDTATGRLFDRAPTRRDGFPGGLPGHRRRTRPPDEFRRVSALKTNAKQYQI